MTGTRRPWILRRWRLDDAGAVFGAFADPDIQRWHVRRADSAEEAAEIVARQRGWAAETELSWAVGDKQTGTLLGRITLGSVDLDDGLAGFRRCETPSDRAGAFDCQ